jgi:hypothetical protein
MHELDTAYDDGDLLTPICVHNIAAPPSPTFVDDYNTPLPQSDVHIPLYPIDTRGTISVRATARLLKKALQLSASLPYTKLRVHIDGGANRSITNDCSLLINYKNVRKYPMNGVSSEGPALICTGVGFLPWKADTGEVLLIKTYYSANAAETIISPGDVITNNMADFNAWAQYSNHDTGEGYIAFHRRTNSTPLIFHLKASNGLWYYHTPGASVDDYNPWTCQVLADSTIPTVNRMTKIAEYTLWHQLWAHVGERACASLHKHVDDQPQLHKHAFHQCLTCLLVRGSFCATNTCSHTAREHVPQELTDWLEDDDATDLLNALPGQHFSGDFGFMKGSGYCKKDEEGRTITSIDGMSTYFLIIDRVTKYIWVFLNKQKLPPTRMPYLMQIFISNQQLLMLLIKMAWLNGQMVLLLVW